MFQYYLWLLFEQELVCFEKFDTNILLFLHTHNIIWLNLLQVQAVIFVYSPSKLRSSVESYRSDDEHKLIARYTACLASNGTVSH